MKYSSIIERSEKEAVPSDNFVGFSAILNDLNACFGQLLKISARQTFSSGAIGCYGCISEKRTFLCMIVDMVVGM